MNLHRETGQRQLHVGAYGEEHIKTDTRTYLQTRTDRDRHKSILTGKDGLGQPQKTLTEKVQIKTNISTS
jgi:hypothetical protein